MSYKEFFEVTKPAKSETIQMNLRWAKRELDLITDIARLEQREKSGVVRFLVRWAIVDYLRLGSFAAMREKVVEQSLTHGLSPAISEFLTIDIELAENSRSAHERIEQTRKSLLGEIDERRKAG